jgi:hypothetical protein
MRKRPRQHIPVGYIGLTSECGSNRILARARAGFSLFNAREQAYPMATIYNEILNSERSGTIYPNPQLSCFSCGLDELTVAGSRYKIREISIYSPHRRYLYIRCRTSALRDMQWPTEKRVEVWISEHGTA